MTVKVLPRLTEKKMTKKILKLKKKYPEGTHWGDGKGKYGKLVCDDFAQMVCKYLYNGRSTMSHEKGTYLDFKNANKAFKMIEAGDQLWSDLRDHTVIVLKKNGNKLTLVEGNYCGTVHWGRTMTKDEFEIGMWQVIKYHKYKWKYGIKQYDGTVL